MGAGIPFAAEDTLNAFQRMLAVPVSSLSLPASFELLMRFYEECRATDALPLDESSDMLLFQWGTYDWGQGTNFEINLTRQIIFPAGADDNTSGDDDPEIWQLRLTYYYPTREELRSLGDGNRWCDHPNDVVSFKAFVLSSPQVGTAKQHQSNTVELVWGNAE